jgi:flagellar biosynthesis/type III secretory pathway chaperone
MEFQIRGVANLLEEEISLYEKLAVTLKKEADCLKRGAPEDLLQSVKAVSEHAEAIHQIHREIQNKIEEMLQSGGATKTGKTLADLARLLPPGEAQRLRKYQGTLEKLKRWVMQINARNKAFIQESLVHWRSLFSFLNPAHTASLVYVRDGKKKSFPQQPVSMDRKV